MVATGEDCWGWGVSEETGVASCSGGLGSYLWDEMVEGGVKAVVMFSKDNRRVEHLDW